MLSKGNECMKNYYDILGVDRATTAKNIKRKTFELGKILHPKKSKDKLLDSKEFITIIEAHTVLYNEPSREIYNSLLDHHSGENKLREQALINHLKKIEIVSNRGIAAGREYTTQPFWIFRDDMKSTFWWNILSSIPV